MRSDPRDWAGCVTAPGKRHTVNNGGTTMARLEANAASDKEQRGNSESAEWKAWMKRALKNFNARARRMMKKTEGAK